jgi:predicted GNAT family N-acyltransferase
MVQIELLSWEKAREEARRVRFTVFVEEQGVPAEIEIDERDAACIHALARLDGRVVGTGRLLPDAHIGRMAVLRECRGMGVGGEILERLVLRAHERGDREIVLSAQVHAIPFYARHGFAAFGPVYEEAGIPHRDMRRQLVQSV